MAAKCVTALAAIAVLINQASAQDIAALSDPVLISDSGLLTSPVEQTQSTLSAEQLEEIQKLLSESVPDHTPRVSYDNGFLLSVPARHSGAESFRMRINSWFQLRHTVFDSSNSNPDQNDIEFERLRLAFAGHVYTPDLTYMFQFDGDGDQVETADWLDYYMSYDVGHHLLCCQENRFGLRFGKWKLPFNRARAEAGWKMQFADRSVASALFDINRSIGFGIFGELPIGRSPIHYELAVFNGFKTSGLRPVRQFELDREFGFSARLVRDVIGQWGSDGESDLSVHTRPAVRIGAGIATTRFNNNDGLLEFSRIRVVDSGAPLASILPSAVDRYSGFLAAVDANMKYQGFSLLTEYYFRSLSDFSGAPVANLFDHGFMVQSGVFLVARRWELIARWSRVAGDSGTLGATEQSFDEVAIGTVLYFRGHLSKLTFDATHLNGAPIRDLALNILPGDAGMLYRTQLQIRF